MPARSAAPADAPPLVEMLGIRKRFGDVQALDGVDFALRSGEVHALLGENGAGKSTLMGVLMGLLRPEAGTVRIRGKIARIASPRDALRLGIGMVHQRLLLSERHTALDNIVLGWSRLRFFPRRQKLRRQVIAEAEARGLSLADVLDSPMSSLPVATRQKVEIVRALLRGAEALILDEPTAVLSSPEREALFALIRRFCKSGGGVAFISHKLDEVLELADRITVLRRGKRVARYRAAEVDAATLAEDMIGRVASSSDRARSGGGSGPGDLALRLEAVAACGDGPRGAGGIRDVSFELRCGEILAIAGVAGSGQNVLVETLAGLRRPISGSLELLGRRRTGRDVSPSAFARAGVAYVPEDRHRIGVAPALTVAENLILRRYRRDFSSYGLLAEGRAQAWSSERIAEHAIACPGPGTRTSTLSGGNLQKVIVARELASEPALIVAAYPFRGLDVGSIRTVRQRLLEAASAGAAIVLISEDLEQIFAVADWIGVMFRGRLIALERRQSVTADAIGLLMGGHTTGGADSESF